MKIAFIVDEFPAISETFILHQITGLIDRGHEVHIFAHSPVREVLLHQGMEKYDLLNRTDYLPRNAASPSKIGRLIRRIGLLIKNFHKGPTALLRGLNPVKFGRAGLLLHTPCQIIPFLGKLDSYDIIHCQFGPNGNLGVLLKDTGVIRGKVVTTFHGYDISMYVRSHGEAIYTHLFSKADLILSVSERIKNKLATLGCAKRKILVHRCGVDTKTVLSSSPVPREKGTLTILTVARLVEKKGIEYGIHAVAKILKRYSQIKYRIVGDGPLAAPLRNLIGKLNVSKTVTLMGPKSHEDVMELLRESTILLAPSVTSKTGDEEGIPTVIMEAFAQGVPVVSTHHSGIPEVVEDGVSGFLVPEGDAEALAEKLARLIEHPELRSEMGRKGHQFVAEYHDIDRLNDRLVEIYQQLLDGRDQRGSIKAPEEAKP